MKIISVVGARPNFIKIAPFIKAVCVHNDIKINRIDHILLHTGQHYDDRMSDTFFRQLNIPEADINLGIGSGSHAEQVGKTMIEFEKVLRAENPDWVVLVGDVNAILACSVTAKKENIKCCHIEAGLRSGDMSMPEEINRLVADRVSDLLLTPDTISSDNLRKEGIPEYRIKFVGNIMIDTLEAFRHVASSMSVSKILLKNLISEVKDESEIESSFKEFGLITLHRPSNVDNMKTLDEITNFLINEASDQLPLVWSIHPRTLKMLKEFDLYSRVVNADRLLLIKPIGYLEMLRLNMSAKIMLTDSGGLQEECTILGTPCLTLRWNTERPIALTKYGGLSVLVGNDIEKIKSVFHSTLTKPRSPFRPMLWDGNTASRCLKEILEYDQV